MRPEMRSAWVRAPTAACLGRVPHHQKQFVEQGLVKADKSSVNWWPMRNAHVCSPVVWGAARKAHEAAASEACVPGRRGVRVVRGEAHARLLFVGRPFVSSMLKGTSTCWSTWLFQAKYLGMKCTKDLLQRCGPTRLELNVPFVKKVDLLRRSRKKNENYRN